MPTVSPFSRPLYVMAKPVGAACNMRCRYCYYLEKSKLYKDEGSTLMSDELLEKFTEEYISSQTSQDILFCWHGGETLLRPISFYEKALALQKKYANGRNICNTIQTNGTLITDEWAEFFRRNGFLVGVSIDGPKWLHNHYRPLANGSGSWKKVMNGIDILNRHQVEWNAMAVVNNLTAEHPLEFYHFYKEINCHYIQFTPIVERYEPKGPTGERQVTEESISPRAYGRFLCAIFDEWVRNDVGNYFIQIFDATLANWMGVEPGVCSMAKHCGHAGVIEHNGDVYSCDHFVFPEYKLGNISKDSLVSMMYGEKQTEFGKMKQGSLPEQCQNCEWLFACNGECPKNRFRKTSTGERGLNYLCEGYREYFAHVAPAMDIMKRLLQNEQPPAMIMRILSSSPSPK